MKLGKIILIAVFTLTAGGAARHASGQEAGGFKVPAGCGDGKVAAPEECDDGNTVDGDGCDRFCQAEPKPAAAEATIAASLPEDEEARSNSPVSEAETAKGGETLGDDFVQAMPGPG